MAARGADEENEAVAARGQGVRAERRAVSRVVVGRVRWESIVRARGEAMIGDEEVVAMDERDGNLIEASTMLGCHMEP